jgi:hypothetical protein
MKLFLAFFKAVCVLALGVVLLKFFAFLTINWPGYVFGGIIAAVALAALTALFYQDQNKS